MKTAAFTLVLLARARRGDHRLSSKVPRADPLRQPAEAATATPRPGFANSAPNNAVQVAFAKRSYAPRAGRDPPPAWLRPSDCASRSSGPGPAYDGPLQGSPVGGSHTTAGSADRAVAVPLGVVAERPLLREGHDARPR